jgi:hypothetical protein
MAELMKLLGCNFKAVCTEKAQPSGRYKVMGASAQAMKPKCS